MPTRSRTLLLALLALLPFVAHAGGEAAARQLCAGCHALAPPAADAGALERAQRAAPPLYFAGSKYRGEWLAEWLAEPVRIFPAGYFPPAHTEHGADGDRVDSASLPEHVALDAAPAQQIAEYLMTLRPPDGLIEPDAYQPGAVALRMGMMDFRKFKGCNACHQDAPDEGGVSGPELHSAWQRLQPAFIYSYVKDPTAWDPHSMMPVSAMNAAAVAKLVNYLKVIGEQQP